MSGLFLDIPHKKLTMFSLDGHYWKCTCLLALCYVCYHLLTGRCEGQCENIFLPVYGIYHILSLF